MTATRTVTKHQPNKQRTHNGKVSKCGLWVHAFAYVTFHNWTNALWVQWVQWVHTLPYEQTGPQPLNRYKNALPPAYQPINPSILTLAQMVLDVLNSDPSSCHSESISAEKFFVVPHKPSRRSRAHNIPGGIKHLSDPKRRRRISVRSTVLPFSSTPQPFSHRNHLRLTRLHHKATIPVAQKTLSASATPVLEGQDPQSPSQPQSRPSVSIDVTFPRHLPELPRKQISPEVLASLGYTPEVPSQYIRDQMERLGPMYVSDLTTSYTP